MARTPETSDYTSVQERIERPENICLRPFSEKEEDGIPLNLKDYLELVDWGGREIKRNKRGYIPANTPPILTRLKMDASPVLIPTGAVAEDGSDIGLLRGNHTQVLHGTGQQIRPGFALGNVIATDHGVEKRPPVFTADIGDLLLHEFTLAVGYQPKLHV